MPKININNISLYYEIHGQGEPIVFISGFSADHTAWDTVIDLFKDTNQVIVFDNRGAGQTDVPAGLYSIEQLVSDVVALCSHLNIKKAHFVGNSMGGYILQMLAHHHPELVRSAVISNSAMTPHCGFKFYVAAQLEFLKAQTSLPTIIKAVNSWVFSYRFLSQPNMEEDLIKMTLENPFPFTLTGYEGQYAALCNFDSRDWINQIKVPTLVLGGDQDIIFIESSIRALAEQIPNAKYHGFSKCGHLPQIEYPNEFTSVVKKFIANI